MHTQGQLRAAYRRFSALQRAEIAEIASRCSASRRPRRFSALQRAEIAEIELFRNDCRRVRGFSALQRAEIAEIASRCSASRRPRRFSALQRAEIAEMVEEAGQFFRDFRCFSALQRAEIAEISRIFLVQFATPEFQCSSTSRNC